MDERSSRDDAPKAREPVKNLGLLFAAAAVALAVLLGIVAVIGYFALASSEPAAPPRTKAIALRDAPPSGQR